MNNTPRKSLSYPTLTHLVEITASDYHKLRSIMTERSEIEKLIKWQKGKFIRLTTTTFTQEPRKSFNQSGKY
jgi:hypothetical protein